MLPNFCASWAHCTCPQVRGDPSQGASGNSYFAAAGTATTIHSAVSVHQVGFCFPNGEAAGLGWVKWWLLAAINFPKGFRGHFLVLVHVVGNLKEGLWHQQARCKLNTKCSHLQKDPSSPQLVTMLLRKRVVEVEVKAG